MKYFVWEIFDVIYIDLLIFKFNKIKFRKILAIFQYYSINASINCLNDY